MPHPQQDTIDGLRAALDFLEAHPDLPIMSAEVGVYLRADGEHLGDLFDGQSMCDIGAYRTDRHPGREFVRREFSGEAALRGVVDSPVVDRLVSGVAA